MTKTIEDSEYPNWTDKLGQVYGPGDLVFVATISGKSPQMVVAQVISIKRRDSKGNLITRNVRWDQNTRTYITEPSCKVTAIPVLDARGFSRYGGAVFNRDKAKWEFPDGVKQVSYSIPENIFKANMTREEFEEAVDPNAKGVRL